MSRETYIKDLVNKRFNRWTVLDYKYENSKYYLYCECNCGTRKWQPPNRITANQSKSCGCYMKEKNKEKQIIDLTGQRSGRLVAIKPTEIRSENGNVVWECKCDCGNTSYIVARNFKLTKSCGCLRLEKVKENGSVTIKENAKKDLIDGTKIGMIKRTKPSSKNTSGYVGVTWSKRREKWKAYISFKKKTYELGFFEDKEEAVRVRAEAKERLHNDFLRSIGKIE